MAGAFANQNAKVLTDSLGRKPTDGELYIAHFLGASARGASSPPRKPSRTRRPRRFSEGGGGEQLDLLRPLRQREEPEAGLCRTDARHDVMGNTRLAVSKPAEGPSAKKGTTTLRPIQNAPSIASTRDIPARRPTALVMPGDRVQQPAPTNAVAAAVAVAPLAGMGETQAARMVASAAPENTANTAISFAPESQGPIFRTLFHSGGGEHSGERNTGRGAVAPVVQGTLGRARRFGHERGRACQCCRAHE